MRRILFGVASSVVLLAAEAPISTAREDGIAREEIVVTGVHSPRSAASIPASTSVFGGADIEATQGQGLTEFFRFIPGLHISQEGARGGRASLSLRGLDPNHVLVLLDGVRLNDPTDTRGGAVDPTSLALLAVDRVEIVRGPLSAVYGSDALAGAINVITRRTDSRDTPSLLLSGGGGRFETGHVAARASAGVGFAGLSLAGGYQTNGDPHSPGGYSGGSLKSSLDANLPAGSDLRVTIRFSDSERESFPSASGGPKRASFRELENGDTRELSGGIRLHQETTDWLDLQLQLSHTQRWVALRSPGIAPGTPPGSAQPASRSSDRWRRTQLTGSVNARPFETLEITFGGDVYWERGRDDTTYFFVPGSGLETAFDLDRHVGGVFAEALYRNRRGLSIGLSVRGDFPNQADTEWSPAAGGSFEIPRTPLVLFGNWSEGYKLPSFFSLGSSLVGNPGLAAERSRGWEIGLRTILFGGRARARLAYFEVRVSDLIDFDPGTFQLVNRSSMLSHGLELDIEVPFSKRLDFGASASYNPTDIEGSKRDLPQRPRWRGELHASSHPFGSVDVGLRVLFVGESMDFSIPTGDRTLANYTKADFTASWQVRDELKLLFAIENLFDADYEEAIGFPSVGIYPRIGAEIRF